MIDRTLFSATRDVVYHTIKHAPVDAWSTQGMGMLRMYPNGTERRIHIWDPSLAVPNCSMIHDHPWHLRSIVLSGAICNTRYEENPKRGKPYLRGTIRCGEGGGLESEPIATNLWKTSTETYNLGGWYKQKANEIHETGFIAGTVTLITRDILQDPDHAHVFWPAGTNWVDALPRPATAEEVERVVGNALKWWDAHG